MPPPIEEDEEGVHALIHDLDGGAPSEQSASDDTVHNNADADNTISLSHDVQSRTSPEPVVSDIPFVTSDIQPPNEPAAPKPVSQEFGKRETSVKRKSPEKRSNYGTEAKRRRGNPRSVPCVLCVRRLANDPKWACHDAVASQDGNPGYNGKRCSECIGSHVSCNLIPPKAVEPVKALVKAAEEVNQHNGSQNLAVLAAYEAAIGPALRALLNIGLQTSVKANEPKTRGGLPKKKKNSKDNRGPSKGKVAATRTLPQVSSHRRRSRDSFAQSTSENRNDFQGQNSDPAVLSTPFQPEQRRNSPIQNSDAFERMERQALRRRKVEALESLAHTAALFLAEFLDFRKAQQVPAATRSPPAGSEQHQVGPGAGVAYAAAAAGMAANVFQPLSQELERSGYNSSGSEMAQHSSSHDTSDDEDLPFRISIEPKVDVDMDDSESDGSSSETSASFRDGVEANDDEPEVKVEEK